MTIGEIGIQPQSTYPTRSPSRPEWYADAQAAMKEMPMIKLFSYFDVSNEVNPLAESYQVDAPGGTGEDSAARALAAYSALANDRYFHQGNVTSTCGSKSTRPGSDRDPLRLTERNLGSVSRARWHRPARAALG